MRRRRGKLAPTPRHRLPFELALQRALSVATIETIDAYFDRPAPPVFASVEAISEEYLTMADETRKKFNKVKVTLRELPANHDVAKRVIVPVIDGTDGTPIEVAPDAGPTMVLIPQGSRYQIKAFDNDGTQDGPETFTDERTATDEWAPGAIGDITAEVVEEVYEDGTPVAVLDEDTTAGGGIEPAPSAPAAPEPRPQPGAATLPPLGES